MAATILKKEKHHMLVSCSEKQGRSQNPKADGSTHYWMDVSFPRD